MSAGCITYAGHDISYSEKWEGIEYRAAGTANWKAILLFSLFARLPDILCPHFPKHP